MTAQALLFGRQSTVCYTDVETFLDGMKNECTTVDVVLPENCLYKFSEIQVNDIKLTSEALSHVQVGAIVRAHGLLIALDGYYSLGESGRSLQTTADAGLVIPPHENLPLTTAKDGITRGLLVNFDHERLEHTSQLLFGQPLPELSFSSVPLHFDGINFKQLILALVAQIDGFDGNSVLLERQGFDDQFYRLLAMLMNADKITQWLHSDYTTQPNDKGYEFTKNFTAFIDQHVKEPVNIKKLQAFFGLSARGLQYKTFKYFGCSPRDYWYNQKLEYAWKMIKKTPPHVSISYISEELGFSSQSRFSKFFQQRFNCKPSELSKKRLISL